MLLIWEMLTVHIPILLFLTSGLSATDEVCRFGQKPKCLFRCHCQNSAICDPWTGWCPDGACSDGPGDKPFSYETWSGAGCQIGNIGYKKNTSQSTYHFLEADPQNKYLLSSAAVNGRLDKHGADYVCFQTSAKETLQSAWWQVDLGKRSAIYKIVIYPRPNCCHDRLNDLTIWIGDTGDITKQRLCLTSTDIKLSSAKSYTCSPSPMIGRYLSLRRQCDREKCTLSFCEIVIMGAPYVDVETGNCEGDMHDGITGCSDCKAGWQLPDCKRRCEGHTYGKFCKLRCGQCSNAEQCDFATGACPRGCVQWWINTTCHAHVEKINFDRVSTGAAAMLNSSNVTDHSITLQWKAIYVPPDLESFYQYRIQYHHTEDSSWNFATVLQPTIDSWLSAEFSNLDPNTNYTFQVEPCRFQEQLMDCGSPEFIQVTTMFRNSEKHDRETSATHAIIGAATVIPLGFIALLIFVKRRINAQERANAMSNTGNRRI